MGRLLHTVFVTAVEFNLGATSGAFNLLVATSTSIARELTHHNLLNFDMRFGSLELGHTRFLEIQIHSMAFDLDVVFEVTNIKGGIRHIEAVLLVNFIQKLVILQRTSVLEKALYY